MELFLLHWNEAELQEKLALLTGFNVRSHWSQEVLLDLKGYLPDAWIISLDRLPSHGRAIAEWIVEAKKRREKPLIFVGGAPEKVEATKAKFPDACYCQWHELPSLLSTL
ncbi:MAG: hypothetical protein HUU60_09310 [Armatimonadetes bacterium]|nr:hypothetical protein [Armatimonadota bacterium]